MNNGDWITKIPGAQKYITKEKVRMWFWGALIAGSIMFCVGYGLRMVQVDGPHREEIRKLTAQNNDQLYRLGDCEGKDVVKQQKGRVKK